MADTKITELRNDIEELQELMSNSKRKKVQDILSLEIRKLETEWIHLKEKASADSSMVVEPSASAPVQKRYEIKINGYGWDQSDNYVKVFVTLKDVHTIPKEQVYCKITEKCMELYVENLDNKNYKLAINNLLYPINVAECYWKQKTDMVVVFLSKVDKAVKWSHMTEIEKKFEDKRNSRFKPEVDDKQDPSASIMGLMKNMYETGDDEMKRMISKAWYEGQHKKKSDTVDL
ncbi:calcyclin-binding protein [Leptidea sinapis]|uniref:Calcyclin-binding protein n=1 Tax=Leptidea sinapis TaxID=189913 RepID=A0A5E4Q4X2_9NEOP|nr:calcyclin-binding protein [Leptidea sinapis]VVC92105.1 unnamed protein product [Leptidea sinapis]